MFWLDTSQDISKIQAALENHDIVDKKGKVLSYKNQKKILDERRGN
jgi:hypothetical protein